MSHMVAVKGVKIKNLNLLDKVVKGLGGVLDRNKKSAKFYMGQEQKCDAVISFKESTYEVALTKQKDGSYEMAMDSFCSKLTKKIGNNAQVLTQGYKVESHKYAALRGGQKILGRKVLPNGTIELLIET